MEDLLDRIAYLVARVLIFLFERIPLAVSLRIGDFLGRCVFLFSKKRRVAYINLKAALGSQLTPAERWKAVRDSRCLIQVTQTKDLARHEKE